MRRVILIVLLIATLASNSRGEMGSCKNNHAKQRKEFIKDLERRIQKNQNLTNELIAEIINSNQTASFLIQSNSSVQVNFSALSELYMTSIPAINSFLTGSLLPSLKSPLNVELNATIKYVKFLAENQTELNYLIGYLYLNDMIQYVSGTTGEQKVRIYNLQWKSINNKT